MLLASPSSSLATKMAPKLSFCVPSRSEPRAASAVWITCSMILSKIKVRNEAKPQILKGQQRFLIAYVKNRLKFKRTVKEALNWVNH